MKNTIGLISILLAVITGLWLFKAKGQTSAKQTKIIYNKDDAEKFVTRLSQLGYFRYADSSDLDQLKKEMIDNFDPNSELTSIWDDNTGTPKDYRYYSCDGETVFEQGGIIDKLKDLKPTFDKLNFRCEISAHLEEWNDKKKWINQRIIINGTQYVIFKNFTKTGWGEAPKRLAEILNIELAKQGINEKIYLASGGNDGKLIFLTTELYKYIYSIYKNPQWKPLDLNEWAKVMEVKPMKLD